MPILSADVRSRQRNTSNSDGSVHEWTHLGSTIVWSNLNTSMRGWLGGQPHLSRSFSSPAVELPFVIYTNWHDWEPRSASNCSRRRRRAVPMPDWRLKAETKTESISDFPSGNRLPKASAMGIPRQYAPVATISDPGSRQGSNGRNKGKVRFANRASSEPTS